MNMELSFKSLLTENVKGTNFTESLRQKLENRLYFVPTKCVRLIMSSVVTEYIGYFCSLGYPT